MKKQYLILILIIVALAGYLVLKKEDRSHYTLPVPPAVDSNNIDQLTVQKQNQTLVFLRTDDGWVVTDASYPADDFAVKQMLDVLKGLTLSALVSEKQDLFRYELDEDHCLVVTAYEAGTPVLSFKIGKTAPTYNHTFVMLENDPYIYHAKDSFRSHFDKPIHEFRDRQVMAFDEDRIKAITIEAREKTIRLTADDTRPDSQGITQTAFNYADGSSADPGTVSNLLSSLSALTCDRFAEDTDKTTLEKTPPRLKIVLENSSPIVLQLFEPKEDGLVPGISSMNSYPFLLKSYIAEDIVSYAHDLAGLTPPEEIQGEEARTTQ
jgi:hypothetical protein